MKRTILILIFALGAALCYGQNYSKAVWSRTKMDSTYNFSTGKAAKVIGKYRPAVDSLLVPIGKTREELKSYPPEDKLSNLAGDIMCWLMVRSICRKLQVMLPQRPICR